MKLVKLLDVAVALGDKCRRSAVSSQELKAAEASHSSRRPSWCLCSRRVLEIGVLGTIRGLKGVELSSLPPTGGVLHVIDDNLISDEDLCIFCFPHANDGSCLLLSLEDC